MALNPGDTLHNNLSWWNILFRSSILPKNPDL